MVDIIKIMEAEDNDTQRRLFEYLLNKAEIVGKTGRCMRLIMLLN